MLQRERAVMAGWAVALILCGRAVAVEPPRPCEPVPGARQLAWHDHDYAIYLRLGMQTFTGTEPTGREDPKLFNPAKLDAKEWVRIARECGFQRVLLTAKDKDGFCLWPSALTDYSIKASAWREGKGDLIREFTDAAHAAGLEVGLHLSAEDRHDPAYGTPAYNTFYVNQLKELLTNYGRIDEVRFDGAGGEGAGALPTFPKEPKPVKQDYDWQAYFATIRALQPDAVIVSNIGPDARWNGNNIGHAGDPNWSPFDPAAMPGPLLNDRKQLSVLNSGDPAGKLWCPSECLILDRPGWYWRVAEDAQLIPADKLVNAYCKSVGRNCVLTINVPVNAEGVIPDADVARLREVHQAITTMFKTDLAAGKPARASNVRGNDPAYGADRATDGKPDTYWATDDGVTGDCSLEVDLGGATPIDAIGLAEPIALGQRVEAYHIDLFDGSAWKPLVKSGKAVGHWKIERFPTVTATKVRLTIDKARACPLIATFAVYGKS